MTDPTRALTIRQPWAGAIAHQSKRVENRSWKLPAKHHGSRILIHAGAQLDRNAQVYGDHLDVYSAVVAVATITGCHWSDDGTCCGPWGFERVYHWTLADVETLAESVPAQGALGFWTPPANVLAAVRSQMPWGTYCPHGHHIVKADPDLTDPDGYPVGKLVDPWPCKAENCTLEAFERSQQEAEDEYWQSLLGEVHS